MNSVNANLYKALRARVSSLAGADAKNYFRYVNQDLGQMEILPKPPVSWPCVLIDLDTFSFEDLSMNAQSGTGHIVFRLGFTPFSNGSNLTPEEYSDKAIYYYDLEQVLHEALHGWSPADQDGFADSLKDIGTLKRVTAQSERRMNDFVRVRILTYALSQEDYSTQTKQVFVAAKPEIITHEEHAEEYGDEYA